MRANARIRQEAVDEQAVSDVLGAVLLVGITVAMMVGLSALVMNLDGPRDRIHVDIRMAVLPGANGWGTGDEMVRVEHVGGEPFPQATARIRLVVADDTITLAGMQLDQGFADGSFRLGDTWERTLAINQGDLVEMLLIDDEGNAVTTTTRLTARGVGASTGGGGTGGTSGVVTYVATGIATQGTLTNFPHMQNASDAGAFATLAESSSGGGSGSTTRSPAGVSESLLVTNPNNVLASNDQRASFNSVGSYLEVTGFTMPVAGVVINSVTIGMEAQRGPAPGSSSTLGLSYEIGNQAGATSGSHTVTSNDDAHYTTTVTGDRTWTIADIHGLTIVVDRQSGGRAAQVDHVYVTVGYTHPLVTDAEATFGFTDVPAGSHELQMRYRTSLETFTVQVWDGATWNNRGTLNSPLFYSIFTHTLQASEYQGGAPQVRIVDRDTGALAGEVRIDYMRIDTI